MDAPIRVAEDTRSVLARYQQLLAKQSGRAVTYDEVVRFLIEVEEAHYGSLV